MRSPKPKEDDKEMKGTSGGAEKVSSEVSTSFFDTFL
jgi:hypothetical protein